MEITTAILLMEIVIAVLLLLILYVLAPDFFIEVVWPVIFCAIALGVGWVLFAAFVWGP